MAGKRHMKGRPNKARRWRKTGDRTIVTLFRFKSLKKGVEGVSNVAQPAKRRGNRTNVYQRSLVKKPRAYYFTDIAAKRGKVFSPVVEGVRKAIRLLEKESSSSSSSWSPVNVA